MRREHDSCLRCFEHPLPWWIFRKTGRIRVGCCRGWDLIMVDLPGKKIHMQAGASRDCNRGIPHNSSLENMGGKYSFEWLLTHCLGFGACWGWVHVAFFSSVLWGNAGEALSLQAWLVNVFANGCTMIALGCLSLKYSPLGKVARRRRRSWCLRLPARWGLFSVSLQARETPSSIQER